jgi:hypothetical protein
MITVQIPDKGAKKKRKARVLGVFSFRYDAHLVPGLLQNIEPMVDGWVAFDDRGSRETFSNEPARRYELLKRARAEGADWALAIDPDERLERRLAHAMPELTAVEGLVAYSLPLREMFAPDAYRVDGIWGHKRQCRLIRLTDTISPDVSALHSSWHSLVPGSSLRVADYNIYHLKMMTPERRRGRRDLYKHLDPDRQIQQMGYDYLADEEGLELETVPFGRDFRPSYEEDNGMWMAEVHAPPR